MRTGTTRRTVRVEDELWDLAQAKAKEQGDNLSAILRDALRQYIEDPLGAPLANREVQAEAWDAGYDACAEDKSRTMRSTVNPHRIDS